MKSVSGIYIIVNVKSNKVYIGQAQNISKRWGYHRRGLKHSKHANRHLQAAWNKYGEEAFVFKVLEYCAIEQLDEREQHYLDTYMPKGICYNLAPEVGTTRGKPCNEETKIKIGKANKGRSPNQQTREKISSSLKGRQLNANQHEAIVKSNQNRAVSDKVKQTLAEVHQRQKGRELTLEHAQNISKALTGHKHSEETKRKLSEAAKTRERLKREALE